MHLHVQSDEREDDVATAGLSSLLLLRSHSYSSQYRLRRAAHQSKMMLISSALQLVTCI